MKNNELQKKLEKLKIDLQQLDLSKTKQNEYENLLKTINNIEKKVNKTKQKLILKSGNF